MKNPNQPEFSGTRNLKMNNLNRIRYYILNSNWKSKSGIFILSVCLLINFPAFSQSPVANFSASIVEGCAPLQVVFTNNSTNAVTYQWTFGDGSNSTIQNPSNIFTTPGNYQVKLVVQDNFGATDSFLVAITVNPKPTASFTVSATTACVNNNQITFNNSTTGANTYLWDFGDGNTSTDQFPLQSYNLNGIYSVKLIANNNFGCTDITEKINHITIYPKPVADFTVNKNYACDTSHIFVFTPSQLNSNYLWNFGDGNTSTAATPSHKYSNPGSYNISLITENIHGCKDTVVKNNFTHVGSNITGVVTADVTSGCPPLTVNFTTVTPGMVAIYYDFGNGNQTSSSYTFTTSGQKNIIISQIDNKSCVHITTLNNFITVHPTPQVSFNLTDTSGCAPYDVQVINTTTNAVNYNWDFGDNSAISTSVNPLHTYFSDGNYNINLEAISANGCTASFTHPSVVKVATPVAAFSSNIQNGCAPLTVSFNNESANSTQLFWDFGDGTTSTATNPVKTYNQTGNYTVTLAVTSANGCTDTIVYPNYIKVLNPYANYTPPPIKTGCAPFSINFTDNTSGNANVIWDFGDGTTSNLSNPTHVYHTPGIYTVSLTAQTNNGCTFVVPNYQTIEVTEAKADFSVSYISCPPYITTFIDSSVNAVSWLWNFGDGNISTLQNPTHSYGGYGTYNVTLTIETAGGCTHTKMIINAVVFDQLSANFTWTAVNSGYPMTVNFLANSTGASNWLWDFGDGGSSTLENPTYTYQQAGQYTVTLTVSNNNCSITYLMSSTSFGSGAGSMDPGPGPGPQPEIVSGCAPFTAQFNDPTTNSYSWLWNFGDGTSSTLQNPVHTYYNPGNYDIVLIVTKAINGIDGFTDTIFMNGIINVSGPVADFNVIQSTDCQSTVVSMTDQSMNATFWNWDFGNGDTSTQQNPVHTFQGMVNNYTISLTASDSLGCSSHHFKNINSGSSQIISANKYSLCKGDTVFFQSSLIGYSFYIWDFGDGNISFNQQPNHIYNYHGNYQVSLTVYSSSGCTFTHYLPVNISVNGPVASFDANNLKGCNSLAVTFENYSNNYTSSQWIFGNVGNSLLNEPTHTFGPGIHDVTLIVKSNGCSDSITYNDFIVVSEPIADFTFTQADICLPSTVQFTNLSTPSVSLNWNFGDATTSQQYNPTHIYNSYTQGDVGLETIDSLGCSSTIVKSGIKFIKGSFTASNKTGCAPFTVNFTSNLENVASVQWLFGDGNTSNSINPSHTYTTPGSYDVKLILTSAGGCTDTITEKALIGVSGPTAGFTHVISSNCIPSIVDFTNTSQNAVSYFWDFGDSTYSSSQNPSKVYNTPGHYTVTLVATNSNGCNDTTIFQSAIEVSGPVTNFSINTTSICIPVTSSFTDLSLNAVSWIWNFGDGNSDSTQNPTHIYADTGIFSVTLIATDTAGCSAVYSLPASIEVRPVAQALFSTPDTIGCTPFNASFSNNSLNASTYQWFFGDGNNSNSLQPTHVYQQSGIYDIELIADNQYGCSDTLTNTQYIDVAETPLAEFTSDLISGCSPLEVQFTDLSSGLQNPVWIWDFNNGNTSNVQNPVEVFVSPGGYTISLTVINEGRCSSNVTKPSLIIVHDLNPPAVSPIHSVSVKSDSEVEITYGYVMDLDLSSYNLYRKNLVTGNYDLINIQNNINSTSFSWDTTIIDGNLSTNNNVYTYKIQTVDICGNTTPLNNLPEYNTINVSVNSQSNGVRVHWNEYGSCSVSNYNVYRKSINQAPQLIATVPATILEYIDSEILCPEDYSYKIEATDLCNLSYNSWSDTAQTTVPNQLSNQKVDVVRSTVVDDEYILTEWTLPNIAPEKVLNYNLYRSENNSNYQLIATLPSQALEYLDMNTDVKLSRYIYSVEVVNICNLTGAPSNIGNSILLNANSEGGKMILNWNGYSGWADGVEKFKVERMDEQGLWKEIGIVDEDTRQFID